MAKFTTIEEWSNRIEAAEPRDYDTMQEAMKRIAKLHLEMLGELAARLEAMPPTGDDRPAPPPTMPRVSVGTMRPDGTIPVRITIDPIAALAESCVVVEPEWKPPKDEPLTGVKTTRGRALNFSNALQRIEAMPCMLATEPHAEPNAPHHPGDGRFACLELHVPCPCATCIAHEALEA